MLLSHPVDGSGWDNGSKESTKIAAMQMESARRDNVSFRLRVISLYLINRIFNF